MKHLLEYILEVSQLEKIQCLKKFINNEIKPNKMQNASDEQRKILNNKINALYNAYNKYQSPQLPKDVFNDWINSKMPKRSIDQIRNFKKIIYSLCEEHNCYFEVTKLINDQLDNNEKSFKQLNLKNENVIYNIILITL